MSEETNWVVKAAGWLIGLAAFTSCGSSGNQSDTTQPDSLAILQGQQLAQKHCQSCHQLPNPDLADKATWENHILPAMGPRLGMYTGSGRIYPAPASKSPINDHLFPIQKLLSTADWQKIIDYYVALAPAKPLPQPVRLPIGQGLKHFIQQSVGSYFPQPVTTLVKVDQEKGGVYFGDGIRSLLCRTDAEGRLLDSMSIASAPSHLHLTKDGFSVLLMGVLSPSDRRRGEVQKFRAMQPSITTSPTTTLLASLPRSVDAAYGDLNGDGQEDIVIAGFGNYLGELAWYENKGPAIYDKHVLRSLPGAVSTVIHDFNGDAKPDIIALMAQGDEGVFIYYNQGKGKEFREERVLTFSPAFGSNHLQLADFDGDGKMDLLCTNGDNADYPPILKNYHGLRIYLNSGNNQFKERFFYPVNGIGKALAYDFDGDGDLDIASIAYFPDYVRSPEESFLYFENTGNFVFHPAAFANATAGRWMVMDVGDIDKDGDADIVLGAAILPLPGAPSTFQERWKAAPNILILKNIIR